MSSRVDAANVARMPHNVCWTFGCFTGALVYGSFAHDHTRPRTNTPHEGVIRPEDGVLHRGALRKLGVLLHVGDHRGLGGLDGACVAALLLSQHLCKLPCFPPSNLDFETQARGGAHAYRRRSLCLSLCISPSVSLSACGLGSCKSALSPRTQLNQSLNWVGGSMECEWRRTA